MTDLDELAGELAHTIEMITVPGKTETRPQEVIRINAEWAPADAWRPLAPEEMDWRQDDLVPMLRSVQGKLAEPTVARTVIIVVLSLLIVVVSMFIAAHGI